MPDELELRIRALEAERLRPVPPPPASLPHARLQLLQEVTDEHDTGEACT